MLSPILANIYLHYAPDLWFENEVKPRMRGRATLIRYCDDFIVGFEREDDVRRVMARERERSGHLRLLGLHHVLGTLTSGTVGNEVQDTACKSETGDSIRHRLVSALPASAGQGPARSA